MISSFHRLLDSIIGSDLAPICFAFLDDIIIATDSFQEHLRYLELDLTGVRNAGLKVNKEKCEFGCSELRYLGFLVNNQGLQIDPSKIEPVLSFPEPKNIKKLRRFLGLASWYRRFIPNYSNICLPINKLFHINEKWHWGIEQSDAMNNLKSILT